MKFVRRRLRGRRPWKATFPDRPKTYSFVSALAQSESSVESAYPRPRDRRLARKTHAAVGKPSGSTTAEPAVSSADSPGASSLPIGLQDDAEATTAVAIQFQYSPDALISGEQFGSGARVSGRFRATAGYQPNTGRPIASLSGCGCVTPASRSKPLRRKSWRRQSTCNGRVSRRTRASPWPRPTPGRET